MTSQTINKVNGGISIFYGIGFLITAISILIGAGNWLYKVFTQQREFDWATLIGITVIFIIMALFGYSLTRVGFEQIEKRK